MERGTARRILLGLAALAVLALIVLVLIGRGPLALAYISVIRGKANLYRPSEPVAILYGADLDTASHRSGLLFPLDIKLKQLSVLEEAGVHIIRLTVAYDIFLDQDKAKIADLDAVTSRIRNDDRKLMIADGAAEQYWSKPMDWQSFARASIERVRDMAARYKPEYYVVVKEPVWYMGGTWAGSRGMITEQVTVEQWVELTEQLAATVRNASPETLVGIAIALPFPESKNYLVKAQELDNVDFVGIDIYSLRYLDTVEGYLPQIKKPRWILETWDGNPDTQQGQIWRTRSAAEWIKMISYYAQSRGFSGLATFYNLWLCYYYAGKPRSLDGVRVLLDKRQKSFYALQAAARSQAHGEGG